MVFVKFYSSKLVKFMEFDKQKHTIIKLALQNKSEDIL